MRISSACRGVSWSCGGGFPLSPDLLEMYVIKAVAVELCSHESVLEHGEYEN
jgi:hypothetical protein